MSTTPKRAGEILLCAKNTVSTERGTQHGGVEDSFAMIAAFWSTWLTNANRHRHNNDIGAVVIDQVDVAQMMSLMKKARFMHGDITNVDHAVDDTGYTSIAAALVERPNVEEGIAAELKMSLDAARKVDAINSRAVGEAAHKEAQVETAIADVLGLVAGNTGIKRKPTIDDHNHHMRKMYATLMDNGATADEFKVWYTKHANEYGLTVVADGSEKSGVYFKELDKNAR